MKIKNITSWLTGLLLSASCLLNVANADLIQADYLTVGDELAVYDTVTDLTWLDLSVTNGISYDDAANFSSDYRYATESEVLELLTNAFGEVNYTSGVPEFVGFDDVVIWNGLFGTTPGVFGGSGFSLGSYIAEDGAVYEAGGSLYNGAGSARFGSTEPFSGVFLVLDVASSTTAVSDVPEPSTLAVFTLVLVGFAARRVKKQA